MRQVIDLDEVWADASKLARRKLELDGHGVPALPAACPFDLDSLVAEDADPRVLSARLAAAVAGG